MYDEAKEKKEQMDDFRVEVRNFIIIIVLSVVIVIREQFIKKNCNNNQFHIFIGPESDHWLCLSVTD